MAQCDDNLSSTWWSQVTQFASLAARVALVCEGAGLGPAHSFAASLFIVCGTRYFGRECRRSRTMLSQDSDVKISFGFFVAQIQCRPIQALCLMIELGGDAFVGRCCCVSRTSDSSGLLSLAHLSWMISERSRAMCRLASCR